MSPQEFIAKEFSKESAPHEHTVRRWIKKKRIPGREIAGHCFVDYDAYLANGDPLVEKVLRDESSTP